MRLLFIECEDSFSWNVIERLPFERGQVRLVNASQAGTVHAALAEAEAVVLGPGPLDPVRAGLLPFVEGAAQRRLPTLGICLGHQALGLFFGARLCRHEPHHGKRSNVHFAPSRCFPGFTGPEEVMRYHSLGLSEVVSPLRVVARGPAGEVMAVEHESLPMAGVQFHPDSFGTPRGQELLHAFFASVGCA
jgi:anthranilate synthase/aminodeoxychorismate synthase-like glutamine amidotransferase